jgi:hypothetical protein
MLKVLVAKLPGYEAQLSELVEFIRAVRCSDEREKGLEVRLVGLGDLSVRLGDCDILIFLLVPELASNALLQAIVQKATASGCRLVGVWPENATTSALPSLFSDYGYATVSWGADEIAAVICGNSGIWDMADGTPRPEPYLQRNKCK